jgi:hypothetical protein
VQQLLFVFESMLKLCQSMTITMIGTRSSTRVTIVRAEGHRNGRTKEGRDA